MLRVSLADAQPGMVLAVPVRHPAAPDLVLLADNCRLDRDSLKRMAQLEVRELWVKYPPLGDLDQFISPKVLAARSNLIADVSATFENVHEHVAAKVRYDVHTNAIGRLIRALVREPQAALFLGELVGGDRGAGATGVDLMRHSTVVTYLSLLMGLKLGGYLVQQRRRIDPARAAEVTNLGLGAMLHDVGIRYLPEETRQQYLETGNESDPAWRQHTSLGYDLVRGRIAPTASTIVLHHHQRVDGSGYAGQDVPVLVGDRIHVFSRIVALADAFDELRFPVGLPGRPKAQVLQYLLRPEVTRRFDEQVLLALLAVVPAFAPGSILRLSDGEWAVPIDHNRRDPCRPIVQLIPDPRKLSVKHDEPGAVIDLAECGNTLQVVECDGVDVSAFGFEIPRELGRQPVESVSAWA